MAIQINNSHGFETSDPSDLDPNRPVELLPIHNGPFGFENDRIKVTIEGFDGCVFASDTNLNEVTIYPSGGGKIIINPL